MLSQVLGGIGLFLLGMVLMTDGLKRLAGEALRGWLARFTGGPLSAVGTGAAVTALVQSSSATTLTTIGFVSAGLLSFTQAVGVICGANIGTTSTSWIVASLGLKLDVSVVALPLVGVGVLVELLARGRLSALGRSLAGFGLVFVGIATLQAGMAEASGWLSPETLPGAGLAGRLLLVGAGVVMTVIMQSSSAATATTLTALAAGSIDFGQAAALVIGQNVGTTVTAAIAAIGASVPARRTALAHVLFNVGTGVVAFLALPVFVALRGRVGDDATALAAFHTAFNLLGVALVLPVIGRFSALVERLVPERGSPLTRHLDRSVVQIPEVAMEVAMRSARDIAAATLRAVAGRSGGASPENGGYAPAALREALSRLQAFLIQLQAELESGPGYGLHVSLLKLLDHTEQLLYLAEQARGRPDESDPRRRTFAIDVTEGLIRAAEALEQLSDPGATPPLPDRTPKLEQVADFRALAARHAELRRTALEGAASGLTPADTLVIELDRLRWLARAAFHARRVLAHAHLETREADALSDTDPAP